MHRNLVSESGGHTFLDKFRNGFSTVMSEVNKVEQITADLDNLQPSSYFSESVDVLNKAGDLYDETRELYEKVTEQPINIDPIEKRLLALREKLIRIEENPELLKRGYQPYIPPDSLVASLEEEDNEQQQEDGVVAELSFSSVTKEVQPLEKIFTPLKLNGSFEHQAYTPKNVTYFSKSDVSKDDLKGTDHSEAFEESLKTESSGSFLTAFKPPKTPVVITNPKLANCLSILQRWNTVVINQSDKQMAQTFPRNTTFIKDNQSTPRAVKSNQPTKPNANSMNRSKTFVKKDNEISFEKATRPTEYETVEFTPGMTTKVIRK